jgi:hypothetical protein
MVILADEVWTWEVSLGGVATQCRSSVSAPDDQEVQMIKMMVNNLTG